MANLVHVVGGALSNVGSAIARTIPGTSLAMRASKAPMTHSELRNHQMEIIGLESQAKRLDMMAEVIQKQTKVIGSATKYKLAEGDREIARQKGNTDVTNKMTQVMDAKGDFEIAKIDHREAVEKKKMEILKRNLAVG